MTTPPNSPPASTSLPTLPQLPPPLETPRLRATRGDWYVAAYAALYLVGLVVAPATGPLHRVVTIAYFGICVATIGAQLRNALDTATNRSSRRGWMGLTLSSTVILIGGLAWTLWLEANPGAPTPDWSYWLTALYMPFAIAGFLSFERDSQVPVRNPRVLLDIALLSVGGLTLSWQFSLRPLLAAVEPARTIEFVTVVGEWAVFVAAAVSFIRSRDPVLRSAVSLLLTAHVGFMLADFSWIQIAGSYEPGNLVDAIWFGTWLLRWGASRYAWHAGRRERAHVVADTSAPYRSGIAPTAVVAGAYVFLIISVFSASGDKVGLAVLAILMTALLLLRQRVELRENTELARATAAQTARFRALLSHASDYIAVADPQLRLVWASPSLRPSASGALGASVLDLVHPDDRAGTLLWLSAPNATSAALPRECRLRGSADSWEEVELRLEDRRDDPNVRGIVLNGRNVSGERALEGRLRHTEKLVTLHEIAGRMAHAFNNLLATIAGHAELLAAEFAADPAITEDVGAIRAAAERGAGITRQLLGFSGSHVIQPVRLPLAATLSALATALERSLPPAIRLELELHDDASHVTFDRAQFEQVVMNLAANARDAMPDGGIIRISLAAEQFDQHTAGVVVRVRDTGVGIAPGDLRQIFEPFYTTKAPGLGTGLGLAMVDTIVRRAGGRVSVESVIGAGTTVAIHLPRSVSSDAGAGGGATETPVVARRGTVLLVDDEASVRSVSRRMLERAGYRVIEAPDGTAALALAEVASESIDILVTDMMMPGLSGREVIARFVVLRPGTPIIVVTGYSADGEGQAPLAPEVKAILAKPFASAHFIRAVSDALGERNEPSGR